MKTINKSLIAIAILSIALISCQKTVNTTNGNNTNNISSVGVDGWFSSQENNCYFVSFYGPNHTRVNAGTVTANGIALTETVAHDYTYFVTYPEQLNGTTHFVVSGNAANGVPAINYTTKSISPVGAINFGNTVSKSAGYTISLGSTVLADTIYYTLHINNPTITLKKFHVGGSSGVSFTSSELASFVVGQNVSFDVTSVNSSTSVFGGKNYRFISQSSTGTSSSYVVN